MWVPPRLRNRSYTRRPDEGGNRLSSRQAQDEMAAGLRGSQVTPTPQDPRAGCGAEGTGRSGRGLSPGPAAARASLRKGWRCRWTPLGDPCGGCLGPAPCGCDRKNQKQTFLRGIRHYLHPRCLKEVKKGKPQTHPLDVF